MNEILIRRLGLAEYRKTWFEMQAFTNARDARTQDEIWLLQHFPVYTQGLSCSSIPVGETDIEVVHSDRGGQITYHGPGQLIVYFLIDLRRRRIGVKGMVNLIERSVIEYLMGLGIEAGRVAGAPGVYVAGEKIAALGLRVRGGASYHGMSFNVDMDLRPFSHIDPCGYEGLQVTQLSMLGVDKTVDEVAESLVERITRLLENHAP